MKGGTIMSIATGLFICLSCKKEKDMVKSKTELLSSGTWKITATRSDNDANGTYETNDFVQRDVCFNDDYYNFRSDGKVVLNRGAMLCNPNDQQIVLNEWNFELNGTYLKMGSSTHMYIYLIEVLDNSILRLKYELPLFGSSLIIYTKQ